jgi:IS5 family transposase
MLGIHCLLKCYNLSDLAAEDALYETSSIRRFALLSLKYAILDYTAILNFRHLLERYEFVNTLSESSSASLVSKKRGIEVWRKMITN